MILYYAISALIFVGQKPNNYPLHIHGSQSAVESFTSILNQELGDTSILQVSKMEGLKNEYGIRLTRKNSNSSPTTQQDRFLCAMNCLFGDSLINFRLWLVENNERVLIGDGQHGIIDIADILKFDNGRTSRFTAGCVLLHELYEQYYLQAVNKLRPGKVNQRQLKKAHFAATQKESNLFDLLAVKTESFKDNYFISIEFKSRLDESKERYHAYYDKGNIGYVEKINAR
jgi:hypothetical protein